MKIIIKNSTIKGKKEFRLLSNLSTYRSHLMGISILMIMAFHTAGGLGIPVMSYFFRPFFLFDIGVEFFIILSAVGCYNSLIKNSNSWAFYKRRIVRLFPTFIVCIIITGIILYLLKIVNLSFFSNLFFRPLIEGDISYWFIGYIIICYILVPILFKWSRSVWFIPLFGFLSLLVFILAWENTKTDSSVFNVLICRFPIYWLSIPLAKSVFKEKSIYLKNNILLIDLIIILAIYFLMTITIKSPYSKYLSYSLLSIPSLLIIANYVSLIKSKWILNPLSFIGSISLELYLLHAQLTLPFVDIFFPNNIILRFIISYTMAIVLAYIVHHGIVLIQTKLSRSI